MDQPLIRGNPGFHEVTETISRVVEIKTPRAWYILISFTGLIALLFVAFLIHLFFTGIGIWGNQVPVGWAFDITNFVFWVGIGHAGTLISAVLFLLRQRWRTSINRFAEAMTIFAIISAGIWPAIHVGRPWYLFYVFPLPNQMNIWPDFRSPLLWDFFAVGTYFTCSLLFWYLGMVPDLATFRYRAKTKLKKIIYGALSLGWRGGNRQWRHYEVAYLLLAGISTPLVLSVHSVVSTDFAVSVLPGWHSTIFPPYFVAGAIFSGFAMVMTLAIIARKAFALENYITIDHFDKMCKIILATGLIVSYSYIVEMFMSWYSGNIYERFTFMNRAFGPYAWAFWIMISCNVFVPQIFWFKKARNTIWVLFVASILINIGMWFERFVIIVTSLAHDFLPSSWHYYKPTIFDIGMLVGSFGVFLTLFLLFLRVLPMIAMSEVKAILPQASTHHLDSGGIKFETEKIAG
ncbi:MAG TPA: hydrogenase [candidate division Zixibacteria bacterium]|nr:hydrogenase [candidate division Zixibacteria bacterium]HBZ01439.1 hydrogenase [candidate division Zixibacteria bacterium]